MKVKVDLDLCQGHSVCLDACPEVFAMADEDDGYPHVKLLIEEPPEELREKLLSAAKYCPNSVITIED